MKMQSKVSETQTNDAVSARVDLLVRRCATCRHWGGDKAEMKKIYKENEVSMDLFKGWPTSGDCNIDYEWLETEIDGDALVTYQVPANFGCVYYGA